MLFGQDRLVHARRSQCNVSMLHRRVCWSSRLRALNKRLLRTHRNVQTSGLDSIISPLMQDICNLACVLQWTLTKVIDGLDSSSFLLQAVMAAVMHHDQQSTHSAGSIPVCPQPIPPGSPRPAL